MAALNASGYAHVNTVSCSSAGECAAGGYYGDSSGGQAFVVSEQGGVWGTASEVPGSGTLNVGGGAAVSSVSCANAGNCAAGGYYNDRSGVQAFVVSEQGGAWGTAVEVPGLAALNRGGYALVTSVSCASPGNCAAGGFYTPYKNGYGINGFVVSEKNGKWGTAVEVGGRAAPNRYSTVSSVSCAEAGDCVAGGWYGSYTKSPSPQQGFVAVETNGTWGHRRTVSGAALRVGGLAYVTSVSCASPGNCAAGGVYRQGSRTPSYAFVVEDKNGTWGKALTLPGVGSLGNAGQLTSVSCPSPGNCSAGGESGYADKYGGEISQAFVVSEKNGKWTSAIDVPGIAPPVDLGDVSSVNSVSCASAGNCAAAGVYTDSSFDLHAYAVAERNGVWGTAKEVQDTATETFFGDSPGAMSVSCASAGNCVVGGSYGDGSGHTQAFLTSP